MKVLSIDYFTDIKSVLVFSSKTRLDLVQTCSTHAAFSDLGSEAATFMFVLRTHSGDGSPGAHPRRISAKRGALYVAGLVGLVVMIQPASAAFGFTSPASVDLGAATGYSVLAATTVTNTGATVISADAGLNGDLGVSPGTAVTGFLPGTVTAPGSIHSADTSAGNAATDAGTAYADAAGRTPDQVFPPIQDIGGMTFTTGVYNDPSSLGITGTVTLDAQGDPNAVFIFQAGSTLVTASASNVALINGAQAANVFWQVGSSATLGTGSSFSGTILASTAITVTTGVSVQGRVLAGTAAVTLDSDTINAPLAAPSSGVPQAPLFGHLSWAITALAFLGGAAVLVARSRRMRARVR
jgi:hypothetical protein